MYVEKRYGFVLSDRGIESFLGSARKMAVQCREAASGCDSELKAKLVILIV